MAAKQLIARCSKCKRIKPTSEFCIAKERKCGHRCECKNCTKKTYQRWRLRNLAYALRRVSQWKREHPERHAALNLKHYYANKQKILAQNARYRRQNREQVLARKRVYAAANRERERIRARAWAKANPARRRVQHEVREARKRSLPAIWTIDDALIALTYWKNRCAACGTNGNRLCWDHWIPLVDPNCPGTVRANMVPLCGHCNSSKGDRVSTEWLRWKFGTRKAKRIAQKIAAFLRRI